MPQPLRLLALTALIPVVIASGSWVARTHAQMATPAAGSGAATVILVEHADLVTEIDLGEPGPTIGDMLVWGPNALYDEANANDTGATTQGTCIAFNVASDCIASETIVFPDGSTLSFRESSGAVASLRREPSSAGPAGISVRPGPWRSRQPPI